MLRNAILHLADQWQVETVFMPTAAFAHRHTDPQRRVGRDLFDRIYDRYLNEQFHVRLAGDWWAVDVAANRPRLVEPVVDQERLKTNDRTVCVCHDLERGWGHRDCDVQLADRADQAGAAHLGAMLEVERSLGVAATYNVVGAILSDVRQPIESAGHCLAFHSFDHCIEAEDQLPRCRGIDYRLKGYRPPQSRLTAELSPETLCMHNFEWLASSAKSLQTRLPRLHRRIVQIPIQFDDYAMYQGQVSWAEWEQAALATVERQPFVAFSLHDCYAPWWLPHYQDFLQKIQQRGVLKTMDQVMSDIVMAGAA
jgi:hypothetical protein